MASEKTYVSEEDRKEQEWNRTQNRMNPIADTHHFHIDYLTLKNEPLPSGLSVDHKPVLSGRVADPHIEIQVEKRIKNWRIGQVKDGPLTKKIFQTDEDDDVLYSDLQALSNSESFHMNRAAAQEIYQTLPSLYLTSDDQCDMHDVVTVKAHSTLSDPMGEYSVIYPATSNWYKQSLEGLHSIEQTVKQEILKEFVVIRGEKRNYFNRIHSGLRSRVNLSNRLCSDRLVLKTTFDLPRLRRYLTESEPSVYGVRQLNHREIDLINGNLFRRSNFSQSYIRENAYELLFENFEKKREFERNNMSHTVAYPDFLDKKIVFAQDEAVGLQLTWYPYPSLYSATITLKDPKDVGFCMYVLSVHGFGSIADDKYDPTNRTLKMTLSVHTSYSHSNEAFEYMIGRILQGNDVHYESINLLRATERCLDDEKIRMRIHRRIGRAACCIGLFETVAGESTPFEDFEWIKYVKRYEEELPWKVELHNYRDPYSDEHARIEQQRMRFEKEHPGESHESHPLPAIRRSDKRLGVERTATVIFEDMEYGTAVGNYLFALSPRPETFSLSNLDRLGVRFGLFFRIRRHIPAIIRTVINGYLLENDNTLRCGSAYPEGKWCRYVDDIHNEQIVVEGWPVDCVRDAAARLEAHLQGVAIDCRKPNSSEKLLHGAGLAYVNSLQEQFSRKAVISIDRLDEKISIIGDHSTSQHLKFLLETFCNRPDQFLVRVKIVIDEPRFLPSFQHYICNLLRTNEIQVALGDPSVLQWMDCHGSKYINFVGSVNQYERLQVLLDEEQQRMLQEYKTDINNARKFENFKFRDLICPICLNPVSYANYRLSLCGHLYCLDCLRRIISYHLKSQILPISCTHQAGETPCDLLVALRDILDLMFGSNFRDNPHFFKDRVEILVKATTEYSVQASNGGLRHCSRPDCTGMFYRPRCLTERDRNDPRRSTCGVCGFRTCNSCIYPPHPGTSCEVEETIQKSAEDSINYYMQNKNGRVKRCPNKNCGAVIEKEAGCNHMHCNYCKIHFCWMCHFTSFEEGKIYEHMRTVHGGAGGGWDHLDLRPAILPPPGLFDPPPGFPVPPMQALRIAPHDEDALNLIPNEFDVDDEGFPRVIVIDGVRYDN